VDRSLVPFFTGADVEIDDADPQPVEQVTTYLYCREVICPHCDGDAPLMNAFWLSKSGDPWGVAVDAKADGSVSFRPYRIERGERGPNGEDPNGWTVKQGVGQCVHCQQAIDGKEIKRQARGESEHGAWQDRLYCVVAVRLEPKLDKNGRVQRYASGAKAGQVKTRKIRYYRAPNDTDLQAIADAEAELERRRFDFELAGLIPNDAFPQGNDMRPVTYGMPTWADLFTPRQLLGHLTAAETLNELKPRIMEQLGEERGRAVVTYLQFAIDKGVDYNSKQTRWHFSRGVLIGTFGRHDFSLKWTFGEMVFAGPSSGLAWGLSQVTDAYKGIADLLEPVHRKGLADNQITITRDDASRLASVGDQTVDAIVMDPPYYDNVQYSELSDFYYVWQKRTLGDLYPEWFDTGVTDKQAEAVANPARDGSARAAKTQYESAMHAIFAESRRVLKADGIMTLMFTHKSQNAWETLTNALIESGWDITATMPVESESGHSTHQMNMAAAASSIFIACRPAQRGDRKPASWSFGGGVKAELETAVREGLKEFEALQLNPVDRMIAAWGRALRVYSAHWPVIDGEEAVTPTGAMQEAARVVAEEEVSRLSGGQVTIADLDAESRLAVIALGINGLGAFAFDDALQLSKSLNLALHARSGNYRVANDGVAYANEKDDALAAPLAKKGSRLRLLAPDERLAVRLANPQTLWDMLCGVIVNYRAGGVVAARNYLTSHEHRESAALRGLLQVWARECRDDALRREALLIDYEL
jgi:adenine-specific DNA methylase